MKRSTLVAAFVLGALVALVYWLERDNGSGNDVDTVFGVEPEEIRRVEILRPRDGESVILEREEDGEGFRLVAPVEAPADTREVELVLSNLETMNVVRTIELDEGAELGEFGLDAPRLEVRFETGEGDEQGLRFGNDTLTPSNQYAQKVGSSEVLIVRAHVSSNLDKTAWSLRDKRIFRIPDDAEPERVSITRGDDTVVLAREEGIWVSRTPPRATVDPAAVVTLVSRFRSAEMVELMGAISDAGLDPPRHRLEVVFTDPAVEPLVLEVGSQATIDYYARVPGSDRVFSIEAGLVEELRRDVRELWSKHLWHRPVDEIEGAEIRADDRDRELDREQARELAGTLASTRADDVVASIPPAEPRAVIRIWSESFEETLTLRPGGEGGYAIRNDGDVALQLSPEVWKELDERLQELMDGE